jgi:hypothetical protein
MQNSFLCLRKRSRPGMVLVQNFHCPGCNKVHSSWVTREEFKSQKGLTIMTEIMNKDPKRYMEDLIENDNID